MKKIGKENQDVTTGTANNSDPVFNYEQEQQKIAEALSQMPASAVDSIESDNVVSLGEGEEDKGPAFIDPDEPIGHTNHPKEFYEQQEDFKPAIEVTKAKSGFSGRQSKAHLDSTKFRELTDKEKQQTIAKELAKPATEQDLSNLDESMIMDMPQIKATSFQIVDMLNPKPKDKTIRFKWANYKNNVAGNLGRYMALGFQVAHVDDVDQSVNKLDASMIDGTQVKWYDVILLKVNVIRLMELYKSNIIRSISKLGRVRERGIAEANRQFAADISATPGAANGYNKIKAALNGREPVEFFTPGIEESTMVK